MEPVEVCLQVLLWGCKAKPGYSNDGGRNEVAVIGFDLLRGERQQVARTLSYMISQLLQNGPLQIAMNARENGVEAWRVLLRQEEPASGASQVASLTALLATRFSGQVKTLQEEFSTMEGAIQRYEKQLGEQIPDSLHQALLKGNTPYSNSRPS